MKKKGGRPRIFPWRIAGQGARSKWGPAQQMPVLEIIRKRFCEKSSR